MSSNSSNYSQYSLLLKSQGGIVIFAVIVKNSMVTIKQLAQEHHFIIITLQSCMFNTVCYSTIMMENKNYKCQVSMFYVSLPCGLLVSQQHLLCLIIHIALM